MDNILSGLFFYFIIILSAVAHEYAHAWAAFAQGDATAKAQGRLTLNPLAHLDWWGTVLMPLLLLFVFRMFFGYAKPVPVNPYNFRNQRWGMVWVSAAGIVANFALAVVFGLVVRFWPDFFLNQFLVLIVIVNVWLGLFNLLPFAPLDGAALLAALVDARAGGRLARVLEFLRQPFGLVLAVFIAMTFLPRLGDFIFRLIVG